MISLVPRTRNPIPFRSPAPDPISKYIITSSLQTERTQQFETGSTFYRPESATARDLAILSSTLYKRTHPQLRILDAMCGCGVRSLRYLTEAKADFVLANDANEENRNVIMSNLESVGMEAGKWEVRHSDANRIMSECYLNRDWFDLIDVDSFGSDSSFLRSAFNALRLGGLVYVTSTDGYSSGGHRPHHALASYGAYIQPMPYCNEIGLRMLIGGAVREASVLGYNVRPLFSYYSYHGPIFRVMLQMSRGKEPDNRYYGFIGHCKQCGNSQEILWDKLGQISCPCSDAKVSSELIVSGPFWTGPLHNATYVTEMLSVAEEFGWISTEKGLDLEKLLKQMIDESDPKLPVGYIKIDEIASRGKMDSPPLQTLMISIHEAGYSATRSHIASNSIKTNCPMTECIRIAKELQQRQAHGQKVEAYI